MQTFVVRSKYPHGSVFHFESGASANQGREDHALMVKAVPAGEHSLYEHPGTERDLRDCISTHGDVALCVAAKKIL